MTVSLSRSVVGRLARLPGSQRCLPTFESRPNLILGHSLIVFGRDKWQGFLHLDQDDTAYARIPAVEVEEFLEQCSFAENLRSALETISFAQDGIDDVHFNRRIAAQVVYGARGSNVGEDEVVVTPGCGRPLGREVRSPVRAHGRDEAEPLLANHTLHVVRQDSHGPAFPDSVVGTILSLRLPRPSQFSAGGPFKPGFGLSGHSTALPNIGVWPQSKSNLSP
jgi:hypothetical protein